MSVFYFILDTGATEKLADHLIPAAKEALAKGGAALAAATYSHLIQEQVNKKLHTRRQAYIAALSFKQENETTWIINLDKKARWIEDGMCVVYGKHPRHIPSVLTPEGERLITEVKENDLVLNQYGKWVRVIKVHDNDLFDYCKEFVDDTDTAARFDYTSDRLSKRSHKPIVVRCPNCNDTRVVSKYDWTGRGLKHCPKCRKLRELVSIKIRIANSGNPQALTLTADHRVMTSLGWVCAGALTPEHKVYVPFYGSCLQCKSKTSFGREFCSGSCVTTYYNNKHLAEGTRPSQDENWMKNVYKKLVAKGGRHSKAEDKFAEQLVSMGYSVGFDPGCDWERQRAIPKSLDKLGRQTYYFLDFYCARLNLCIEVDGKVFHSQERDDARDAFLRERGIETVRIPAKIAYKPNQLKSTLEALLSNHEGEIELREYNISELKKFVPGDDCPFSRRWDITVEDGESFVCQGVLIHNSQHEMIDSLLKSPKAKRAKDGSRYLSVPFEHKKGPTQQTQAGTDLTNTIKNFLTAYNKKHPDEQIPYGKIETHSNGVPKINMSAPGKPMLLHSFSIMDKPLKTAHGPGQGKGPIGQVRQGPTGIPFLQNIRIYQKQVEDPKTGKTSVQRSIVTFRTVSSKHKGTGRWVHPGLEAMNLMDKAVEWALKEWDTKIRDQILADVKNGT